MEQIRIRQPKIPAVQSFIQILKTFLGILFNLIAEQFSYLKRNSVSGEQVKPLVILDLALKRLTSFIKGGMSKGVEVKNLNYLLCFINFQIYFLLIT